MKILAKLYNLTRRIIPALSLLSFVFFFFLIFYLSSFISPIAFAQTTSGSPAVAKAEAGLRLITSPLPINLVTEPGKTITTELKVKNGGTQEEKLKINLMKFSAYEDSGQPKLMDPEPQDDFLKWVTFSESSFSVAPEEWKTITATFTVPESASFGYYYAVVFSRAEDPTALKQNETAVVGGTAVLVLLEARVPNAQREITVTEFSTPNHFYEFLPITFNVKLKNSGNVHIAPRGNIFIGQGNRKDIAILEVNSEKGNILPDSHRNFEAKWTDGFPIYQEKIEDNKTRLDEQGRIEYELKWNFNDASKLRFGKYQAKLLLIYDDGSRDVPIEGEVEFWVVPWRLLGAGFVVAVFFLVGLRSTLRNLWRKVFGKKRS
jgi:hypothetical protein